MTTKSYRVKFASNPSSIELAGIVDRPEQWPPQATDAKGPTRGPVLVYSHCFTCNKDLKATVRISRALARQGVAVLRYDMRGLGGSGGRFQDSNFSTNLDDLSAAVAFARRELGAVTGLVGHSFGGIASLVAAATRPREEFEDLKKLGFVATLAAPSDTQHLAKLLLRMNPAIESNGEGEVSIGGVRWTVTRQMIEDFRSHQFADQLRNLACPVLLMHSPDDETVHFDHAVRLFQLIQQPADIAAERRNAANTASLISLPGADHLLSQEPSDLQFVANLIASWSHRYLVSKGE